VQKDLDIPRVKRHVLLENVEKDLDGQRRKRHVLFVFARKE